jgi:tagaturonate reductase
MTKERYIQFCHTANKTLERLMPVITPVALVCGYLFDSTFRVFKPFVPFFFAFLTFTGALHLTAREIRETLKHPLPIFLFLLLSHVLIPVFVFLCAHLAFFASPALIPGFIVLYSGPTALTSTIWGDIYKGNAALTLTIIIIDFCLAPLTMPLAISVLAGSRIAIDPASIAASLTLMVVLPTILGIFVNEASHGKIPALISPPIMPLSKLSLFFIITGNTAVAATAIDLRHPMTYWVVALCFVLGVTMYFLSNFAARLAKLPRDIAVSLVLSCSIRNIASSATVAIQFFSPLTALPCLVGVVFPQPLAAIIGAFLFKVPAGEKQPKKTGKGDL